MSLNKKLPISAVSDVAGTTHFNIVTWTGDGNNNRAITGVGFQPGMVWIKKRSSGSSSNWRAFDSVRGADRSIMFDTMDAQYPTPGTSHTPSNYLISFDSNGFTISSNSNVNGASETYVAFCWKLTHTTSTNSDGARSATIAVNDDLGLSVSTHAGVYNDTATTVGHGLSATPDFLIAKNLSNNSRAWRLFNRSSPSNKETFSSPSEEAAYSFFADPTSSIINIPVSTTVGTSSSTGNGEIILFYAMRNTNFMQFGTYEGSSSSVTVSGLPFQPRFIFTKNIDNGATFMRHYIQDTVRGLGKLLYLNESSQEGDFTNRVTMNTDGFTIATGDTAINNNGDTFVYWVIK